MLARWLRSRRSILCAALCLTCGLAAASAADAPAWTATARSGAWSDPATWEGGKVPAAGARVYVQSAHLVTYDVEAKDALRAVYVAGTLNFVTDKNTRLDVGVLKIESCDVPSENGFDCDSHAEEVDPSQARATVTIGTPDRPVAADVRALIRLVPFAGQDPQSCPALVSCGGRLDIHGAPLSRTWVKLGATAVKGAAQVTLSEKVTGWRVGDKVIVTATQLGRDVGGGSELYQTEDRFIKSIDGDVVTLDQPLVHEHLGTGEFRGEMANLSRNVIVESAEPNGVRGHTMYHRGSAGAISYAEFRHLGKKDVLGRYSLHFHLLGDTMRGAYVEGASIWDSHNRWLTIHGTSYLVVRDCVGFKSIGHGYFLEDGTETMNVLDRNLAVQAVHGKRLPKQVLPFDANEGAGYWWANSLNTFTRNVSCENDRYGYRFEATDSSSLKMTLPIRQANGEEVVTDIRTLPFVRFDDNEAHCDGLYGINIGEGVNRVGPDDKHPFVMRNTKIWEIHYALRPQSPSLLVENLRIHNSIYGVYHPNFDRHVYRDVTISRSGRGGDAEPFNRGHDDDSTQYGTLTVDGLTFLGHGNSGMPLIQISDHNPTGQAESHFRNVRVTERRDDDRRALVNLGGGPRPEPKSATSVPVFIHDYYGPGRHARVASVKSAELKGGDAGQYKADAPLTGDESRAIEVRDVAFPELLAPVDDLPPATVVTHLRRTTTGWVVSGVAEDNGEIAAVVVNGVKATADAPNFARWSATLPAPADDRLTARSTDQAGNLEQTPHVVTLPAAQ